MSEYLLFTPNVVNLTNNSQCIMDQKDIFNKKVDFAQLLKSIESKLLKVFDVLSDDYRAVVLNGASTIANESILSSVVGDKNILIITNGECGERLVDISSVYNKNTFRLSFNWGQTFDLTMIDGYLKRNKIDVIAMVHHENSSGMLNPIDKVGALAHEHKALFIVDGVSAAGAEKIDMEKCHIDFLSSSIAKTIGAYSGLSFVIGRTNAFEKLQLIPAKTMNLNLYKFYYGIKSDAQTTNTTAIHLFYALEQTLVSMLVTSTEERYAILKNKTKRLREALLTLNLTFLIEEKNMCSVLTAVNLPKHINMGLLRERLRDKSIIVSEGKGCFANKMFKVGNIGELSDTDLAFFISTLGDVLSSFSLAESSTKVISAHEDLHQGNNFTVDKMYSFFPVSAKPASTLIN